jgi:WD40 repeat protein
MDLSPDGERLASADEDRVMRVWAVDSGKQVRSWSCSPGKDTVVRFAPDGRRVAGGGRGFEARIWDAETGKLLGRCCDDLFTAMERKYTQLFPGRKLEDFGLEKDRSVRSLFFLSSRRLLIGGERPGLN